MKMFYVPGCKNYGRFYVIMADGKAEVVKKIKSLIKKHTEEIENADQEHIKWSAEYEIESLKFALKAKKGWEECEDGIFKGEWA